MKKVVASRVCAAVLVGLAVSTNVSAKEGTRTDSKVKSYINNSDYKIGFAFDRGASFAAQLFNTVNLSLGNDGIAGDYLILTDDKFNQKLPFTWYVGVGGFYDWDKTCHDGCGYWNNGIHYRDSDHYFRDFGVRAPFGLDWNFASRWDTYIQLAPVINVADDFELEFQGAIGIRYAL